MCGSSAGRWFRPMEHPPDPFLLLALALLARLRRDEHLAGARNLEAGRSPAELADEAIVVDSGRHERAMCTGFASPAHLGTDVALDLVGIGESRLNAPLELADVVFHRLRKLRPVGRE